MHTLPPLHAAVPPPPGVQASRSLFPFALVLAVGLSAFAACSGGTPHSAAGEAPAPMAAAAAPAIPDSILRDTLREPLVIRTAEVEVNHRLRRILTVEMNAIMETLPLPDGKPADLRTWKLKRANGHIYNAVGYPGPTFRVRPGDSVNILLRNYLPDEGFGERCERYPASTGREPSDSMPNCLHRPNGTNIHFHGFHVSPRSPADNVLIEVEPGGSYQYAFRIPQNQSPGTHWYHPHKHGSVALQVTNGMSGAFIVEGGGLDSATAGMREHLVAIQQVAEQVNLVHNTGSPPYAVNGQVAPWVIMRPGEVQRWRIVNENVAKATNGLIYFTPDGPKMYDVARDGVQFAPANYSITTSDDSLVMAPGNRLDVLVKAPDRPGLHEMRISPVAEDESAGESNRERLRTQAVREQGVLDPRFSAAEQPQTLVRVYVTSETGENYARVLPETLPQLPDFLGNLPSPGGTQVSLVFSERGSPGNDTTPPTFFLGTATSPKQQFNPNQNFLTLPLGQTQDWKIENRSLNGLPHPFHIHINPFQVMEVVYPRGDGDPNHLLFEQLNTAARAPVNSPIWLDVIPLPLPVVKNGTIQDSAYIRIRQRYDNYTGAFVMHCHILGHEERGMMQRVEVVSGSHAGAASTGHAHPH
jgi:FtsP/CotA-like multicopper oxidase with cupredoxin domain